MASHMKMIQHSLDLSTSGRGSQEITEDLRKLILNTSIQSGLCHLFLKHTSASLIICENYDIQVRKDLENFLARLVPDGDPLFKHIAEGKDDMPAHIRTILSKTEMTVPIHKGDLLLGQWQGIFLYEHRYEPHKRSIAITIVGQ